MLCQKDVAVVIPIGTASVRKCRPEEGYDGSVDGVCDVEGAGVAGNVIVLLIKKPQKKS